MFVTSELLIYFFLSLSAENWSSEKSLSGSDRREPRSSSYLCRHGYWSEPRRIGTIPGESWWDKGCSEPGAWFGSENHGWLGAGSEPPSGCTLGAVRDFCNISVVALLSVGNRVRFCSVYYTGSVTRINQNCLKKNIHTKKKKSNKVLFQLWLVSVTMIDGSAIHYAKTRLLTWNFRIQFYDLQGGPPSYLQRSSLFRFNLRVIETRATDLGYSLSRFSNGEEKEAPVMLITELKRSFCLLNPICFTHPCRRRRAVCQRCWAGVCWAEPGVLRPTASPSHAGCFRASLFLTIPLFITIAKYVDMWIPRLHRRISLSFITSKRFFFLIFFPHPCSTVK